MKKLKLVYINNNAWYFIWIFIFYSNQSKNQSIQTIPTIKISLCSHNPLVISINLLISTIQADHYYELTSPIYLKLVMAFWIIIGIFQDKNIHVVVGHWILPYKVVWDVYKYNTLKEYCSVPDRLGQYHKQT